MKYSIKTYIVSYYKHLFHIQLWGFLWYRITPKKIREYFIATVLIDNHESGKAIATEEWIGKANKIIKG